MWMLYNLLMLSHSTTQSRKREVRNEQRRKLSAFTLLELMVVVSIVGIFTLVAVPNFKKAYQDFCKQKTLSDADTLLQSYRSYYLIRNEFSEDSAAGNIMEDVVCFLPFNFFKRRRETTKGYSLSLTPFYDSKSSWDFNNWITWIGNKTTGCIYLSVHRNPFDSATKNTWLNFFKKHYPLSTPQPFYDNSEESICLPFPEFPLKSKIDSVSKNRYYWGFFD